MTSEEAEEAGIHLKGIHILDPSFTQDTRGFGQDLVAVDYAQSQQQNLGLNDTFMQELVDAAKENGLYNFTQQHLTYPPADGHIYAPDQFSNTFQPWAAVYYAAAEANPCFDVYDITLKCPSVDDRLGFAPDANQPSANNFLNNQTGVVRGMNKSHFFLPNLCSHSCSNHRKRHCTCLTPRSGTNVLRTLSLSAKGTPHLHQTRPSWPA